MCFWELLLLKELNEFSKNLIISDIQSALPIVQNIKKMLNVLCKFILLNTIKPNKLTVSSEF